MSELQPSTECKHDWSEEYYGVRCKVCDLFYPHGCEPWAPGLNYYDSLDDDEDDEDFFDCGWVRGVGCTLAGTEECDFECPYRAELYKGLRLVKARMAKKRASDET